jgi:hypothetical protein
MPSLADQTTGAVLASVNDDLDDAPGILVKTGNTLLYGYELHNVASADTFIQCFDKAALSDVTLGSTTPDYVIPVAANGIRGKALTKPLIFVLGLCIFSTTTTAGSTGAACDTIIEYA